MRRKLMLIFAIFIVTSNLGISACGNNPVSPPPVEDTPPIQTQTVSLDPAKTNTGFYWPTGETPVISAVWKAQKCNPDWPLYGYPTKHVHSGADINAALNADVYAIADGIIKQVSLNDWGSGNVALVVHHQVDSGEVFTAVYGHIVTTLKQGDTVKAGKPIGKIGHWSGGDHLHFVVYNSASYQAPYGRLPCPADEDGLKNMNGTVDPIEWITTHSPLNKADEGPGIPVTPTATKNRCGDSLDAAKGIVFAMENRTIEPFTKLLSDAKVVYGLGNTHQNVALDKDEFLNILQETLASTPKCRAMSGLTETGFLLFTSDWVPGWRYEDSEGGSPDIQLGFSCEEDGWHLRAQFMPAYTILNIEKAREFYKPVDCPIAEWP